VTPFDFCAWDIFQGLSAEESALVWREIDRPGFARALVPKAGALDALESLRSDGHEVVAVTSPHFGPNWMHERAQWLTQVAGFRREQIVFASNKAYVTGDLLVDDNPCYVRAWRAAHPDAHAVLWHIPNTRFVEDEPIWLRATDWRIVRWLLRRISFHLEAAE
jgi:5'(3')-deoxyribonucleotidase